MAKPFNWLSKVFAGDPGGRDFDYTDPVPVDPGVFDYESWKDRTLANRQHMGMVPTEIPIPGYSEDKWNYKGQGPGYQPLHERTQTMYVNPALAGTSAYESWYPKARYDHTGELRGDTSEKELFRFNEALFPPQITNRYPLDPDYAALWAGDEYMGRVGDEPAFYDATQSYTDEMTNDYVNWLNRYDEAEKLKEEGEAYELVEPWRPETKYGSYDPRKDRIKFNVGAIRGSGPEMLEGSGIDRFGHENRYGWRNIMDEVARHELKHSLEQEFGRNVPYPIEEAENPMSGRMENYPQLGWGDTALHREIYMGDPIWSKGNQRANIYSQGLPATWKESENVMAMHNWAKDQYLGSQPAERPNMRDVAGPVRREPVVQERAVRGRGPSRAQQRLNTGSGEGPPGYNYNTGGIASLML